MKVLASGAFQVRDGEEITFDFKSSGTLFGVNFALAGKGSPVQEGKPLKVTMDKSQATGKSVIPNAKLARLTLLFSFSGESGGKYDWTVSGDPDTDTFPDFAEQAGGTGKATTYAFHIV